MAGSRALRGRLPGSTRLATGVSLFVDRLEGKIGELVVEQETAHHGPRSEGVFDRRGHGKGVAVVVDDGDVAGAAFLNRTVIAESALLHVRRRSGGNGCEGAFRIDQGAAFGKVSRVEQPGERDGNEIRIGEVTRAVGESEPLRFGDDMRGARAERCRAEIEWLDDAEHLRHGNAAGGRRPHAADLVRAIGRADRFALDGAIGRDVLSGELARLARIVLHRAGDVFGDVALIESLGAVAGNRLEGVGKRRVGEFVANGPRSALRIEEISARGRREA